MNLVELLRETAKDQPNRPALELMRAADEIVILQSKLDKLSGERQIVSAKCVELMGEIAELRSRLAAYRERTIVRGSFGAKCNVCRGEWAYARGDELHEDWCPNRPIVVEKPSSIAFENCSFHREGCEDKACKGCA